MGDEPLRNFLVGLGGWPMVSSSWSEVNFNLTEMLMLLHLYNNNPLIMVYVGVDVKNSSSRILVVGIVLKLRGLFGELKA